MGGMAVLETDAPETRPKERRRLGWRTPVRWFGFACLMGAAFFAGYVAWLLWGTGLETKAAQEELRAEVLPIFEDPKPLDEAPEPGTIGVPGDAYAIIEIPAIGIEFVVVEGTAYEDLQSGPGHYLDTADPWDGSGRVGIAGHRTTYLAPFLNLDDLATGDEILLHTEFGIFTYGVTRNFVVPSEGSGVVLEQTKDPTLVLTTCNPKYSSSQRLIIEADLIDGPTG
jgi:sortase A